MANPSMQIRIAANIDELRRNLAEGRSVIQTTTAAMDKLASSLDGSKLEQRAHNITAAIDKVGGAAKLTAAEAARMQKPLDDFIRKADLMGTAVPKDILATRDALQKVGTQAVDTDKKTGLLSGTMSKLAGAFAIGSLIDRAVTGIFSLGKQAFDTAGQIVDLSNKTGLSIKAVQQYGYVASQSGSSLEQYTDTIFKLGIALEQGGDKARKSINALGLGYEQIRSLKPEQQFDAIMRALAGVESVTERNRIGVELMGKSYANVAAAVDDYIELIGEAPAASDAAVKATDAAGDAMVRTWEKAKSAAINAIGGIIMAWEDAQRRMAAEGVSNASQMGPFAGSAFGLGARAGAFLRDQNMPTLPAVVSPFTRSVGGPLAVPAGALSAVTGPTKEATAAADALKKRLDVLTGRALQSQVRQLASDVEMAGRQGGIAAYQYKELGESLAKLKAQGAVLPPILDDIRLAHEKAVFAAKVHVLTNNELNASFKDLPKADLFNPTLSAKILPFNAKNIPGKTIGLSGAPTAAGPSASQQYGQKIAGTIVNTAMGGGNIGVAVGSQIGHDLGTSLAKSLGDTVSKKGVLQEGPLSKMFGQTIGGAFAAAIPGIGALLGPLMGKLSGFVVGLFTGGEGAKANDLRDSIKAQLFSSIEGLENDPQVRAAMERFNRAGSRESVQSAANDAMKAAQQAKDAMSKYGLSLDQVGSASDRLAKQTKTLTDDFARLRGLGFTLQQVASGGAGQLNALIGTALETGQKLPASLQPYIDALVRSGGLTDDLARKILGVASPVPWQEMQEAAERYGISIDALGLKFEQAKLDDTAAQLAKDWNLLAENGADINAVMAGMRDEVQGLIDKALRLGITIPDSMRPLVEKLFEAGQLTDENGNKLEDLSKINFAEPIISDIDRLIEKLDELIDKLSGGVGGAINGLPDVDVNTSGGNDGTSGYPNPQYNNDYPEMAAGGIVRARRGGTVVRVGEAGRDEAIVPLPSSGFGGGGVTVVQNFYNAVLPDKRSLDGFARQLAPSIITAVKERGLTKVS